MNVVGNAVKFTKEGFVAIDIGCIVNGDNADLTVAISDTGIGIPEGMISKIFESFSQVDGTSRREFEGTGLGLAISKRFVEAMNGSIDVTSTVGVGTTFTLKLTLPMRNVEVSQKYDAEDLSRVGPLKILLVDDIELNRRIIVERFKHFGHQVIATTGGKEALAMLDAPEHISQPFDLTLLDYQMPNMDGLEVAKRIRSSEQNKSMPIIMLSSVGGIASLPEYALIDNIYYLEKPAPTPLLSRTVCQALGVKVETEPQSTTSETLYPFGEGLDLLVVEDTKTNQMLIKKISEKVGFTIHIASNGEEGVEQYKAISPDIILMDWSMPVMNGPDATRAIRALEEKWDYPATPIIGLSANAMHEHEKEGLNAGMDAYLSKPIKKQDLLNALEKFVQEKKNSAVS